MSKNWKILVIGIKQFRRFKNFSKLNETEKNSSEIPKRLVRDILNLGPVFIKIGQILSTRTDMLPIQYINALQQLQENVPPFEFNEVKTIVETELSKSLEQLFTTVDEKPIASASLAQVHFAITKDGKEVAIKVQRKGIKKGVENDLKRIEKLLSMFNSFFPKRVKRMNLINGFSEFKRYTLQELDYLNEGETIERFANNFKDWDDIILPKVFWSYSTDKVLTMERVDGLRLKEAINVLSKVEKEKLNIRLAEMELKMFISDGLFHADLHPGNIFFKEDGKIVLLDFGMYGELTTEERNRFVLYWLAVVNNDVKKAFYHFKKQCRELSNANENAFYNVFEELANNFYSSKLKDVSITKVYIKMIDAGFKFGYLFPENLLLHAKALTTAEALSFDLAPNAHYEKITKPIIIKELTRLILEGDLIKERVLQTMPDFFLIGEIIPSLSNKSEGIEQDLVSSIFYNTILNKIRGFTNKTDFLFLIIKKPTKQVLVTHFDEKVVNQIMSNTFKKYQLEEPKLPKQKSFGATITIHLACYSVALYNSLLSAGKNKEEATTILYDISWDVYTKMGDIPMLIASIFSTDKHKKMELTTQVFRTFPFSSPDYGWEDVEADNNTIAFNCTQCRVAEYFMKHNIGDVCYDTWCKLDFPLAEKWGGKLERTGSIANGDKICDFIWKTK